MNIRYLFLFLSHIPAPIFTPPDVLSIFPKWVDKNMASYLIVDFYFGLTKCNELILHLKELYNNNVDRTASWQVLFII